MTASGKEAAEDRVGDSAVESEPAAEAADGAAEPADGAVAESGEAQLEGSPTGAGGAAEATEEIPAAGARPRGRARPLLVFCAVFTVLALALAAVAVWLGLGLQARQRHSAEREAALHAARLAAADLMTIDYRTAGSDLARIVAMSTGPFRSQVISARPGLIQQVEAARSVSTANVLAAGLTSDVSGGTAQVIVVVDATITSKNAPNGVVDHYRETVTVTREGSRWLASQVTFASPAGQ
jgi:Mce-associated membrane protein